VIVVEADIEMRELRTIDGTKQRSSMVTRRLK
jgi:hypothetical protein